MTPGIRLLVLPLATVLVALAGAPSFGADEADKASRLDSAVRAVLGGVRSSSTRCRPPSRATRATTTSCPNFLSAEHTAQQTHDFTRAGWSAIEAIGPDGPRWPGPAELRDLRPRREELARGREVSRAGCSRSTSSATSRASPRSSARAPSAQPFKTVKDYDNWLARGAARRPSSTPPSPTCARA